MERTPIKERTFESKGFPEDLGIRLVDLLRDPELIIKKVQQNMEKAKIICMDCHKFVTFKFTKYFYSFKCECGIHLFYPPRSDRDNAFAHKFISSKDYRKGYDGNPKNSGQDQ